MIVSTTTSTQDSGLLDVLVPLFEQQTGYSVKTISVGTGQALALAARGEADVTLAHAPAPGPMPDVPQIRGEVAGKEVLVRRREHRHASGGRFQRQRAIARLHRDAFGL